MVSTCTDHYESSPCPLACTEDIFTRAELMSTVSLFKLFFFLTRMRVDSRRAGGVGTTACKLVKDGSALQQSDSELHEVKPDAAPTNDTDTTSLLFVPRRLAGD